MFNDSKLIIINEISDKLFPKIDDLLEKLPNHILLILAQNLEKKSKIRSFLEKDKKGGDNSMLPGQSQDTYGICERQVERLFRNKSRHNKFIDK